MQASYLTLELTEGIIMRRLATERGALEELRRFGLRLSIDDFGMGYSSLAHLSALPIDSLKVDRTFVADLFVRDGAGTIVRTILGLGRSLGMQVVAEGIETEAQLQWLVEAGCEAGQGRHLAHPLDAPAVENLLSSHAAQAGAAVALSLQDPLNVLH